VSQETIPRVVTKVLLPYILLFALYVQFHGDYGPGGGFQAGVIFAAGLVLYSLVFGLAQAMRVAPVRIVERLAAVGVLIYGLTGMACLLLGGKFLDYAALDPHHPHEGQDLGIFLVELGVGLGVASVMVVIFVTFAGRRK
jgi:multicomponent Na+:H+ antiporter subunit B